MNIEHNVGRYLREVRDPCGRSASFGYCLNYFQAHQDAGTVPKLTEQQHLETACLQLGFYLASWGMLRGRAALRTCSMKALEPVIGACTTLPAEIWAVDVDAYDFDGIDWVLETGRMFAAALPGGTSATLVTKAMLGVFGCVPAYDRYFGHGLKVSSGKRVSTLTRPSLHAVAEVYRRHADAVDAQRIPTLDFAAGAEGGRFYTKAKIMDMVLFVEGGG